MLPAILVGSRRRLFRWLLLNGLTQSLLTIASATMFASLLTRQSDALPFWPALALFLIATATVALRRYELRDAELLGQDYVTEVRLKIFTNEIQGTGAAQRHGIAMTRMTTDLASLKNFAGLGIARISAGSIALIVGLTAIGIMTPAAFWPAAGLLLALVCAAAVLWPPLRSAVRSARRYRGRLAVRVGDLLMARSTLIQFNAVCSERKRMKRISQKMASALARRRGLTGTIQALPEMLVPVSAAAFGLIMTVTPDMTLADALFAIVVLGSLARPLRDCLAAIDPAIAFLESRHRLGPVLEDVVTYQTGRTRSRSANRDQKPCPGERSGPWSNETATFSVAPGKVTAFLSDAPDRINTLLTAQQLEPGETGLRLLLIADSMRVQAPNEERDLVETHGEPRQPRLGLVSPGTPLLRRSLRRNLTDIVHGPVSEDRYQQVIMACGLAEISDKVRVDEVSARRNGQTSVLTPTELARVRLARSLLHGAEIIVVDDTALRNCRNERRRLGTIALTFNVAVAVVCETGTPLPSHWNVVRLPSPISPEEFRCE